MRLHVKKLGTNMTPEDSATIERRVHFALGRFGHRIRRTEVLLVDSNGPRGGLDQHCTVHVVLAGLPDRTQRRTRPFLVAWPLVQPLSRPAGTGPRKRSGRSNFKGRKDQTNR